MQEQTALILTLVIMTAVATPLYTVLLTMMIRWTKRGRNRVVLWAFSAIFALVLSVVAVQGIKRTTPCPHGRTPSADTRQSSPHNRPVDARSGALRPDAGAPPRIRRNRPASTDDAS